MGADGKRSEVECDYLAAEARHASVAIGASLLDIKRTLLTKADPCGLARQHPRIAIGMAAAVGITAGAALVGRRGRPPVAAGTTSAPPMAESSAPAESSSGGDGRRTHRPRTAGGSLGKWILGALQGALGSASRLALESGVAAWTAAAVQASQDANPVSSVPCTSPDGEDVANENTRCESEDVVAAPL
ncbi:MAG TPA: hypothetical protein VND64_04685 [Pirellulales bacterium]|nr:hypothetical protein [Pirellulales bacterium]